MLSAIKWPNYHQSDILHTVYVYICISNCSINTSKILMYCLTSYSFTARFVGGVLIIKKNLPSAYIFVVKYHYKTQKAVCLEKPAFKHLYNCQSKTTSRWRTANKTIFIILKPTINNLTFKSDF